jgi:cobalt-zinc-cadmium efflux system protein
MSLSSQKRLALSLFVTVIILLGETVGGIVSNSLALLSDAGHVLTDAFALGLSLIAALIMRRPSDYRATYGYQRIGLLAALINGISLIVIAIFIFIEAYRRLKAPPEIDLTVMLWVAAAGLVGNVLMALILMKGVHDLNVKSAWLHVLGDTVSSLGVICSGLIILFTGWRPADPIASGIVGIMIVAGGVRVIKEALWVFLEMSPANLHAGEISRSVCDIPGVFGVHDVHIWSIGHGIPAFSAHVIVSDQKISDVDGIRKEIERQLEHIGIKHSVIQMECAECASDSLLCQMPGRGEHESSHEHHNH